MNFAVSLASGCEPPRGWESLPLDHAGAVSSHPRSTPTASHPRRRPRPQRVHGGSEPLRIPARRPRRLPCRSLLVVVAPRLAEGSCWAAAAEGPDPLEHPAALHEDVLEQLANRPQANSRCPTPTTSGKPKFLLERFNGSALCPGEDSSASLLNRLIDYNRLRLPSTNALFDSLKSCAANRYRYHPRHVVTLTATAATADGYSFEPLPQPSFTSIASSTTNFPSLYFCERTPVLRYFQPTTVR